MKNLIIFKSVLVITLSIIFFSCSDNPSTDTSEKCAYDSVLTNNGFILNAKDYNHTTFNLENFSPSAIYYQQKTSSKIIYTGYVCLPKGKREYIVLSINFPGDKRGTFKWENLVENSADSSYATLEIVGTTYVSISGETVIKFYDDIGKNNLIGTFSGQLQDGFGNILNLTDGRFDVDVTRLK